jgi:hypothetical protein
MLNPGPINGIHATNNAYASNAAATPGPISGSQINTAYSPPAYWCVQVSDDLLPTH